MNQTHTDDAALVRDHSERLARLEAMPEKIDKLEIKIDRLAETVASLRAERNIIVAIIGAITGLLGGYFGHKV